MDFQGSQRNPNTLLQSLKEAASILITQSLSKRSSLSLLFSTLIFIDNIQDISNHKKIALAQSSTISISKSEGVNSISVDHLESFIVGPNLLFTLTHEGMFDSESTKPFHIEIVKHPLVFRVLDHVIESLSGTLTRVVDKNSKDTYCLRFFPDNSLGAFQLELYILCYIHCSMAELAKEPLSIRQIHEFFKCDMKSLFVSFAGFGREFISVKESWFSNLFRKSQLLHEKPISWGLYEPGLCDLRTVLNTVRSTKFKIPLYFGWMFLVKLAQILINLKQVCLGHLDIRPEHIFILADSTDPWLYSGSTEECNKALRRLTHLKLGGFGSARLVPDGKCFIEYENCYTPTKYRLKEIEHEKLFNPYQMDMYSIGMVMNEILENMDQKYYGHVIDKHDKKHVLEEKTKGLLKGLVSKMTEPIHARIGIEGLWDIICDHTHTLLSENPLCFTHPKRKYDERSMSEAIRSSVSQNESEVPVAIFHAFNMKYDAISEKLIKFVKECGFSHIQISPTQKSKEYGAWHDKYQPLGYTVQNRYGNAKSLEELTKRAHSYGIKILADIVFNHMGTITWFNHITRIKYETDKKGYHSYRKNLIKAYAALFLSPGSNSDPQHYFTEWHEDGWMGGSLPQLNTMHPDVKTVQINYLKLLRSLGVDGFRFDAIKTIDKQSLRDYVSAVGDKWLYGEYVSCDAHQNHEFTPIMPITDFVLLNHFTKVFSLWGTLRDLRVPETNWDPRSVIFAVNHDTWAAKNSWFGNVGINMVFSDDKDAELATLFILARHDGVPLILKSDTDKASIQAGVKFRREMHNRNAPMESFNDWVPIYEGCNLDNFLLMQRGSEGIFILNKGGDDIQAANGNVSAYSFPPGHYVNAEDGCLWRVYENGNSKQLVNQRGTFYIPRRSGVFLIRINNL